MSPFQRKLAAYSRDRTFLIRAVLTILAACVLLGFVVAKFSKDEISKEEREERVVRSIIAYESDRDRDELTDLLLERGQVTPEALAHYITFVENFVMRNLGYHATRSVEEVMELASPLELAGLAVETHQGVLTTEQILLFESYVRALYQSENKETAREFLAGQAAADPPVRFANAFLGQALSRIPDRREEAISYFAREAELFPRADFARFRQLDLNLQLNNDAEVKRLLDDRDYRRLLSSYSMTEIGARTQDPLLILEGSYRYTLRRMASRIFPLALFAGMVWFIILSKLGGVERLRSSRLPLYALGVLAGFASILVTDLFIIWQEEVFGFEENGEFLNDLLYCISGIGLREETAKILLFLPFVPFIAKRRTQIEILITAGCVGLGFAIIENIDYFDGQGGTVENAFPRLVTASFAHVSLTGILGLALCRFWHWPKKCWEEFVGTFVAVVLVHGLYDALLIVKELKEQLGVLAFVVFVLLVRYYFKKIGETRGTSRQVISPLGVFVIGATLVVGASWIFAMRHFNLDLAIDGVGKSALASAILAFLYINEFRNE